MKVQFFTSIETLVERVGRRFKNRLQRLCATYRERHPNLCNDHLKFAVSVGWSFLLAAQGGDIGYAQELTHGLDGNNQAVENTGLNGMHLQIEENDFEYVRDMTFDIALLLFEEMTPTPANQVFYDYLGKRENFAYQPYVLGDESEPTAQTSMAETKPVEEEQAMVKKYQAPVFESVQQIVLDQPNFYIRKDMLRLANELLMGTGWINDSWAADTAHKINEMGCAPTKTPLLGIERARLKMDEMIVAAVKKKEKVKQILCPYVAGIRAKIITNSMTNIEFNKKYGSNISQSSFSEYCPKGNEDGKFLENETEPIEIELRQICESKS